ncbi:uncharacterized protein LOC124404696 [Diprion similis]|uniref:uncharacterized protein LOC124404696 n=1 Tax=Diprion similis TaxID=362088 RepID=UPI001EF7EEFF|nr:uncharacterized protein LOC124404696 [Diprion similis]
MATDSRRYNFEAPECRGCSTHYTYYRGDRVSCIHLKDVGDCLTTDNGTNFVGSENLFKKIDWKRVSDYSRAQKMRWSFNPPSAPWWGGWWERLVGLVKRLLRRILGKACLTYEEMMTTLCDCESVINSRPMTYVSDDPMDLVSLSPSMFLQETREIGVPDCDSVDRNSMVKRMRHKQKLRDDLRRRFRAEYLGQLMQRNKSKTDQRMPKVGDTVMIGNDIHKRLEWPLARVLETIAGNDGEIRVVRLKTASGEVTRPVQRVYPLELNDNESGEMRKRQIDILPRAEAAETAPQDEKPSSSSTVPEEATITRRGRSDIYIRDLLRQISGGRMFGIV